MFKPLFDKLSLTLSMLLLTVVVGCGIWFVSDHYQAASLNAELRANLETRFSEHAREQRIRFDQYVKSYNPGVKLYASNAALRDYVRSVDWSGEPGSLVRYENVPPWLPSLSSMRQFVLPRYAMLLDSNGGTREIYHYRYPLPPRELLSISPLSLELSIDQGYLTFFGDRLYLIASERIEHDGHSAILLIASPIDEQFLHDSQGVFLDRTIIGLLRGDEDRIFISSSPELVASGTSLKSLQQDYLVTGERFFDSGSADIIIRFFSLISTDTVQQQIESLLNADRRVRAITAFSYILAFALVMLWITSRIRRLSKRVISFSNTMEVPVPELSYRDELLELDSRFRILATAVHSRKQSLEYEALHDSLTDIPNRKYLNQRLQEEILATSGGNHRFALMICDLNRFKQVNDTYGHQAGDAVIRMASERLRATLRKIDLVARLGGDEFAIVLKDMDAEAAALVAEKIIERFAPAFRVSGYELDVGISIGIALYPHHGAGVSELMKHADDAMYISKRGKTGYAFYPPEDKDSGKDPFLSVIKS